MSTDGMSNFELYIAAGSEPAADGAVFESIDPASGQPWATFAHAGGEDIDRAVRAAHRAFEGEWRTMTATKRGRALMRFAEAIEDRAAEIAAVEVRDNGKLYREMLAQLTAIPDWFRYFGGLADKIEGRVIPLNRDDALNYTLREPLGVVAIIVPWNSPVLIAAYAMAPALAAGNCVVLKPSEFAPASLLLVAEAAAEAGLPPGVVNVVTGDGETGRLLVDHPLVRSVAFTGSTETGARVAAAAAGRLARSTLELGGKSANIIFDDANLDAAEAGALAGIYAAAGQTCVAGSRLLVQERIYDEFVDRIASRARTIKIGHPMADESQMGPIANAPQLDRVERMVVEATSSGAELLAGGERVEHPDYPNGYFYKPTLLGGLAPDEEIVQSEVFGPVLAVLPFATENDAVMLANSSRFGLAAGVWTQDVKRAHRMAARLEAGTVWVNLYRAVTFNSPFGGTKDSGLGRVNGAESVDEFLQTKSVWVELSETVQDPFVLRV